MAKRQSLVSEDMQYRSYSGDLKPCLHVTSASAFASNVMNGFCGNKWWCLHLKFQLSRTGWQRSKENENANVRCKPGFIGCTLLLILKIVKGLCCRDHLFNSYNDPLSESRRVLSLILKNHVRAHRFTFLGEFFKEGVVEAAGESGQVASRGEARMNPSSSGSAPLVHEL